MGWREVRDARRRNDTGGGQRNPGPLFEGQRSEEFYSSNYESGSDYTDNHHDHDGGDYTDSGDYQDGDGGGGEVFA
jgi:hypothetical protein